MDSTTISSAFSIVILSIAVMFFVQDDTSCKQSLSNLQIKYEKDTTPIKLQISSLKTDVFDLQNEKIKLQDVIKKRESRNTVLEKNILGKFNNESIITKEGDCVAIADTTKGDLSFLQVKNTKKCNSIFSYDPSYKQISVKIGTATKCIDAFNENDIVLNDCIKNSQKQKFDYYPLFNNKLYSGLYSKCISYDKESNILKLESCDYSDSIVVSNADKNLFLQNK